MKTVGYSALVARVGWLLGDLEKSFENLPSGATVDGSFIRSACTDRVPSGDETALVLSGLAQLEILLPGTRGYVFDAQRFDQTRDYRRGFRDGVSAALDSNAPCAPTLCVSLPPDVPHELRINLADAAADLRASVVNVVAAATQRLVLASPFWDVETAADIGELARRRVDAGVQVDILGRGDAKDDAISLLSRLFTGANTVRIFRWYEPSVNRGATTFHFKAVIADSGARTYVGTANLTRGGLRSTMELGFIVGGPSGRAVARIVDSVIALSERVGP